MWVFQVLIRRLASYFCSYKMFDCFFNILKLWHTFLMVLWSCCADQHSPRDCEDSETALFVLAYLACHCEWKVSWGGWGGLVATFISPCPGLLNNFPLHLCSFASPCCASRWFVLHNPCAQTGISKAGGEARRREAARVFGSMVWERSSLRGHHVKPFPREY